MELDGWDLTEEEMEKLNNLDEGASGAICPYNVSIYLVNIFFERLQEQTIY